MRNKRCESSSRTRGKLFVRRNLRSITRLRANACTRLGPSNGILNPRFAYARYTFQPRFPERFSWEKTLSLSLGGERGEGGRGKERGRGLLKKSFTSRYLAEVLNRRVELNAITADKQPQCTNARMGTSWIGIVHDTKHQQWAICRGLSILKRLEIRGQPSRTVDSNGTLVGGKLG